MRPTLLALLLAPGLLSACGGGGDAPTASAPGSAARQAYAVAAEGVCARAVAAGRAVPRPATAAQYVSSYKATLAVGEEGLRGLRALTPPPEDAVALQRALLGPLAEQVRNFRVALPQVEAAARSADPTAALGRIPDPGAAVTVDLDYVERYGMPACATFLGKR